MGGGCARSCKDEPKPCEIQLFLGTEFAPSGLQKVGWILNLLVLDLGKKLLVFPQKLCVVLGKRWTGALVVP